MLEVSCHCSAIAIRLPRRPRVLTACNCSMCVRVQPLFAYYVARTVSITAPDRAFESYVWGKGKLRWYRCRTCGCFTHHHPVGHETDLTQRTGVNLRLADVEALRGLEVKVRDGAADTWKLIGTYRYGSGEG